MEWKNTERIAVLGGGESGVGAAVLAQLKGYEVFLSDAGEIKEFYRRKLEDAGIEFESGVHSSDRILQAGLVVKSPGIPEKAGIIQEIRKAGIQIVSEIEFAAQFTEGKIVAITGSNGKTTTTSLTYEVLSKGDFTVGIAGNIGQSFALQLAEDGDKDVWVLEVSSFQLDDCYDLRPYMALLLNITPDHLDRYDYSFDKYAAAKFRIQQAQTSAEYFVYNIDDPEISARMAQFNPAGKGLPFSLEQEVTEGGFADTQNITIRFKKKPFTCQYRNWA